MTVATRLADPVLVNLAERRLHERMPVEAAPGPGVREGRAKVSHLEAFGRLLCGIAPWLELAPDDSSEGRLRAKYRDLAVKALAAAVDPASSDRLNFTDGAQALVDAAFLSQAILRAPKALWENVDATTRGHVVKALESTRVHTPGFNNWLLFAATVEAALKHAGASWDRMRVDYAIRQHQQWYKGDGTYGDGPDFHWDYYNSFVIHPMLLDVLDTCASSNQTWARLQPAMVEARAALRRDPGAPDLARRHVPADRPLARLSLRRLPGVGAHVAASRAAGRRDAARNHATRSRR